MRTACRQTAAAGCMRSRARPSTIEGRGHALVAAGPRWSDASRRPPSPCFCGVVETRASSWAGSIGALRGGYINIPRAKEGPEHRGPALYVRGQCRVMRRWLVWTSNVQRRHPHGDSSTRVLESFELTLSSFSSSDCSTMRTHSATLAPRSMAAASASCALLCARSSSTVFSTAHRTWLSVFACTSHRQAVSE